MDPSPLLSDISPAAQLIGVQVATSPPSEYPPIAQSSQSVVVDGFATAFWPAGQVIALPHVIAAPPPDHSLAAHAVHNSVAVVAPVVTKAA